MTDRPLMSQDFQNNSAQSSQKSNVLTWLFVEWWLGELLAVLASCGLTIALCIVLNTYQDQTPPTFATAVHSGITLNTLVSLLSTLSVALALFAVQECFAQLKWLWYTGASRPLQDLETYDQANRGLVGAASLLWKLRVPPVASLGALLVLVHLAVAPLAQQAITYPTSTIPTADPATIATTQNYYEPPRQAQAHRFADGAYGSLGPGMKGAIFSGLFAPTNTTINNTQPACGSGNCTFPDYQSLAICSNSADVSSYVQNRSTDIYSTSFCLPGDFCLTPGDSSYVVNITSATDPNLVNQTNDPGVVRLNYTSIAFQDHPSPLADFYIIYENRTTGDEEDPAGHTRQAIEFVFDWCIPTFQTSVTNGTASTVRLPNPNLDMDADPYSDLGFGDGPNGPTNDIDDFTHASLQRYLWNLLSGTMSVEEDTIADSDEVIALAGIFMLDDNDQVTALRTTTASQGLATLDKLLNNTAVSMTNYLRGLSSGQTVYGQSLAQQTTVAVTWGYLAAPIAFSALAVLFFCIVVGLATWNSKHSGKVGLPPKWKSSSIPTLRALDPQLQAALGAMTTLGAMTDEIAGLKVHLERDGDGWKLVEATTSSPSKEEIPVAMGRPGTPTGHA